MRFASHHDAACAAVAFPDPSFLHVLVPFAVPVFASEVACAVVVLLARIGEENAAEGALSNPARHWAFH